ncbi:uncharacterized protein MEPE_03594 [Melanopsichium pennsylvanicum]|uniref:Uncharacterized protein n=1 Tax=Melanopsichium pennsylvanicum TaxID=63383 RepID=A0AAJ5C5M0_9BASI|nr:uncharacterized protein MEPE_03594 [Melanopsichium pennsylvanicum]
MTPTTNSTLSSNNNTANGPGKHKKFFPESQGISHLVALSQSITNAKSDQLDKRIQQRKAQLEAFQSKKVQSIHTKNPNTTTLAKPTTLTSLNRIKPANIKAHIKAELKTNLRQKAKIRKNQRKQSSIAHNKTDINNINTFHIHSSSKQKPQSKPTKSVSFALV